MRYSPLSSDFYKKNRDAFCSKMLSNSIAILTSNDIMPTNADDAMGFAQNNDLLYLCGIDQEETILLLYPDAQKAENRAMLFIRYCDDHVRTWEGDKLSKEEATRLSGVKRVEWAGDFEYLFQLFAFEADHIYLGHNEHIKRLTGNMLTRQDRMIEFCRRKYPLHKYERVARITRELRPLKSEEEIGMIKKAADISTMAFKRALGAIRPGIKEYEVEAELAYVMLKNGASRQAFKPIVASGPNACALHYNTNHHICKDGDMILIDFGACYGNYNSDTTRCVPANGRFSQRQKAVYSAVLHCLEEGSKNLIPGVEHAAYERQMAGFVEEQLIKLGLLDAEEVLKQDPDKPLYKKYFMHGTAHHIGLDVHDVGLYSRKIEAGMVFTCEPGIYIREEGIGCRLENDYLITKDGPINLTADIPISIEEIESIMANKE
jgi:Xaa-Pro aminopeptidase